jgi:hypothetical protein
MKATRLLMWAVLLFGLSGCLLTKIVTVPMRVVGAVVSIIPAAGDAAHGVIDTAVRAGISKHEGRGGDAPALLLFRRGGRGERPGAGW